MPKHSDSRTFDRRSSSLCVAYQGRSGAFGEAAVRAWRADAVPFAVRTFAGVVDAVTHGVAEFAVIPVWNSAIGPVRAACAALDERAAAIVNVDNVDVPVRHCLIALPDTALDDVRYVGSHPAAFAQCARFIARRSFVACEAYNTAGAAHELSAWHARGGLENEPWYARLPIDAPRRLGVIASAAAAARCGLVVLEHDVQDDPSNVTRFVVVRARMRVS